MEEFPIESRQEEGRKSFERFLDSHHESAASAKHPERNEDNVLDRRDLGLFGIFDGVSGSENGEKASALARDCFEKFFEKVAVGDSSKVSAEGWKNILGRAMEEAAEKLKELRRSYKRAGPDTTATVAKIINMGDRKYLAYAHVGDSRLYLKRAGELFLEQISDDDDLLKFEARGLAAEKRAEIEQILANVESQEDLWRETATRKPLEYYFSRRNIITNSLAEIGEKSTGGIFAAGMFEVRDGDIVILTSDGIHDNLTADEIQKIVLESKMPEEISRRLLEASQARSRLPREENMRAKRDDMSVVAVKIK